MRRTILLFAIGMVLGVGAAVADPAISSKATPRRHPDIDALNEACRAGRRVAACLEFVREEFRSRCEREGEQWKIVTEIELDLVVHFVKPSSITHELLHVADIKQRLPRSLEPFTALRFGSEEECTAFATVMSHIAFTSTVMNHLRAESNRQIG